MNQMEWNSATGLCKLNVRVWEPENQPPAAILQMVHGMAEHIDRYDEFARFLASNGILVVGSDNASHGKSISEGGSKGYLGPENGWNALIEDLRQVHESIKQAYCKIPCILMGHSMGSFLARSYASRYGKDMNGFIFCGTAGKNPALPLAKVIARREIKSKGLTTPSKLLDSLSFGSYNKAFRPNRTEFDWLSANEENVDRYIADENCGFVFTAAGFRDLFDGLTEIGARDWAGKVPKVPILVIAGDKDPVGAFGKGPGEVAAKLTETGHDVILRLYEGMRHEILNETGKEAVWKDVLAFVRQSASL